MTVRTWFRQLRAADWHRDARQLTRSRYAMWSGRRPLVP